MDPNINDLANRLWLRCDDYIRDPVHEVSNLVNLDRSELSRIKLLICDLEAIVGELRQAIEVEQDRSA